MPFAISPPDQCVVCVVVGALVVYGNGVEHKKSLPYVDFDSNSGVRVWSTGEFFDSWVKRACIGGLFLAVLALPPLFPFLNGPARLQDRYEAMCIIRSTLAMRKASMHVSGERGSWVPCREAWTRKEVLSGHMGFSGWLQVI